MNAPSGAGGGDWSFITGVKTFCFDQVEMNTPRDREVIERRFGPLGSCAQSLAIRGVKYSLAQLLSQIGAEFDDSKPIDALALAGGHYVLRYIDGQDQRVVAAEFDDDFRMLSEVRASLSEWEGDGSNLAYYSGH
jgi:hypothetical protein